MENEAKKDLGDYTLKEISIGCKINECYNCPFDTDEGCKAKTITKSSTIPEEWELETPLSYMQTKAENKAENAFIFVDIYKNILKNTQGVFGEENMTEAVMMRAIEAAENILTCFLSYALSEK